MIETTANGDAITGWENWPNASYDGITAGGDYGRIGPGIAVSQTDSSYFNPHTIIIQAGSEAGQQIEIELPSVSSITIGVDRVDVSTQAGAGSGINTFKDAITYVNYERTRMGAYQNRMEHTVNNLNNVVENTQAAESVIRDADMAKLMVEYSNSNILAQAGQAMLAQANCKYR